MNLLLSYTYRTWLVGQAVKTPPEVLESFETERFQYFYIVKIFAAISIILMFSSYYFLSSLSYDIVNIICRFGNVWLLQLKSQQMEIPSVSKYKAFSAVPEHTGKMLKYCDI